MRRRWGQQLDLPLFLIIDHSELRWITFDIPRPYSLGHYLRSFSKSFIRQTYIFRSLLYRTCVISAFFPHITRHIWSLHVAYFRENVSFEPNCRFPVLPPSYNFLSLSLIITIFQIAESNRRELYYEVTVVSETENMLCDDRQIAVASSTTTMIEFRRQQVPQTHRKYAIYALAVGGLTGDIAYSKAERRAKIISTALAAVWEDCPVSSILLDQGRSPAQLEVIVREYIANIPSLLVDVVSQLFGKGRLATESSSDSKVSFGITVLVNPSVVKSFQSTTEQAAPKARRAAKRGWPVRMWSIVRKFRQLNPQPLPVNGPILL